MSKTYDIEIRILSRPIHLCVVRQAVSAALDKYGFDQITCGQVSLALDEALANIMRHGYEGRDDQPIWVKLSRGDANGCVSAELVVEDLARQVDPQEIAGRDLSEIRPGGLGVHIMREVMDHVEFTPRPEGGMRLVMIKKAPAKSSNEPTSGKCKP